MSRGVNPKKALQLISGKLATGLAVFSSVGAGLVRPKDMSPSQFAAQLQSVANSGYDSSAWSTLAITPIVNPDLNALRLRFAKIPLPLDDAGKQTLAELIEEATALASDG